MIHHGFSYVYEYWSPKNNKVWGDEWSSFFPESSRWITFINSPARGLKYSLIGQINSIGNFAFGFSEFDLSIYYSDQESAVWRAQHQNNNLLWQFDFRGKRTRGEIATPPESKFFYSVHSLAFDSQMGRLFEATGEKEYFLPTISLTVKPYEMENGEIPVKQVYFHLCHKPPPEEAVKLMQSKASKKFTEKVWLQATLVNKKGGMPDPKQSFWQMYTRHEGQLVATFTYIPQYPSCYSLVSPLE